MEARAEVERYISEDEYLELEAASLEKNEYFDGCIYAMAGATPRHNKIIFSTMTAIGVRLRGHSCDGAGSDQRVKVEATGLLTYPDVLIVCPPERYDENDPNSLLNPRVLIEVLSPSTENYDRTEKFEHYKKIESLTDYILIEQNHIWVDHYQRAEDGLWTVRSFNQHEQIVSLPELELELPLDEIYGRLDLPIGLRLTSKSELAPPGSSLF